MLDTARENIKKRHEIKEKESLILQIQLWFFVCMRTRTFFR